MESLDTDNAQALVAVGCITAAIVVAIFCGVVAAVVFLGAL